MVWRVECTVGGERDESENRYFHSFECGDELSRLTWSEVVADPDLVTPAMLVSHLQSALEFLTTAPGPNLSRHQLLAPQWLEYWIDKFSQPLPSRSREPLMPFTEVLSHVTTVQSQGYEVGVLFAAGLEGTPVHRQLIQQIREEVQVRAALDCHIPKLLVLLDPPENFIRFEKPRVRPYLSLATRLAMWRYGLSVWGLSVSPAMPDGVSGAWAINDFYADVFRQTGAMVSFAEEDDPHLAEKMMRGERNIVLSHIPSFATSITVEKLFPDHTTSVDRNV